MAIHVALNHKTQYRYDRRINLGPQVVRLRPAPHCRTPILSYSLKIEPGGHFINWQQDPQGNYLARLVFPEPTTKFFVEVDLVAEMSVFNPFDFFLEPSAENYPFTYDAALTRELRAFLEVESAGPELTLWLRKVERNKIRTIDFLIALNQRLQGDIGYVIRMEPGIQTCEETLTRRTGSCRDSAWVMVQILRHLGLAARFVSGYLIQLTPDVKSLDGPSGAVSDFTDLHAWTEVYLPGAGWIGFGSDVRTAGGRRAHSAGMHAGRFERRAYLRWSRRVRDGIRAPYVGAADFRIAARHEALYGRAVAGDRHAGTYRRCAFAGGRRAADYGRRTHVRVDRRRGWRGMGHKRVRAEQAADCRWICFSNCAIDSRRARCCISGRANGIRGNRCRVGRWAAIGARTACRSGKTRR